MDMLVAVPIKFSKLLQMVNGPNQPQLLILVTKGMTKREDFAHKRQIKHSSAVLDRTI